MNLALFGYRQFAMGSMVAFIYGTALFGSTYLLPVYMQLGLQPVGRPTSAPSCCRPASCWRSPSPASAGWPTGSRPACW